MKPNLCCVLQPLIKNEPCKSCWTKKFWNIITNSGGDATGLEKILSGSTLEQLSCFNHIFNEKFHELDNAGWPGGRDGYDYKAMYVISRGEKYFNSILKTSRGEMEDVCECQEENEEFSYVAWNIAENELGEEDLIDIEG